MDSAEVVEQTEEKPINPLEKQSIGKLILKYSLPAILSSLVSSIYNIVDQMFVGNSVGLQGNAATNIAFPLVMVTTALAMLFGAGGASAFSLYQGTKEVDKAKKVAANSLTVISSVLVTIFASMFLRPLLYFFGGRDQTLEYAMQYTRITALGIPLAILGTGASQLIRANGSPKYAMVAMVSGAVLNCILDPVFIFAFDMGMMGAALATVIGQFVMAVFIVGYFVSRRTFGFKIKDFLFNRESVERIFRLGLAAGLSQLAIMALQIVMNNTLGYYGELSQYGRDIPIGCVGIISKVNSIFASIIFGISQSTQPICGYNYGMGNVKRVKKTYFIALIIVISIGVVALLAFEIFPRQLISLFGSGESYSEDYFTFATLYFRIFLCCTPMAAIQMLSSNFFPSIGKGTVGMIVSLSRQCIILLPLVAIFPVIWGIDGVLYAGPIADGVSGLLSLLLVLLEMRMWNKKESDVHENQYNVNA